MQEQNIAVEQYQGGKTPSHMLRFISNDKFHPPQSINYIINIFPLLCLQVQLVCQPFLHLKPKPGILHIEHPGPVAKFYLGADK